MVRTRSGNIVGQEEAGDSGNLEYGQPRLNIPANRPPIARPNQRAEDIPQASRQERGPFIRDEPPDVADLMEQLRTVRAEAERCRNQLRQLERERDRSNHEVDETVEYDGTNDDGHIPSNQERIPPANPRGCSYKTFMSCKPPEFSGSTDPVKSLRWIREMEQTFDACDCDERHKVVYAVRLLKGTALDWWDTVSSVMGRAVVSTLTWPVFIARFREDYCNKRDTNKLEQEFLMMKMGKDTLSEFNRKFTEKLRFARRLCPDEESVVTRYVEALPSDYRAAVRRATTLNAAMIEAGFVSDDLRLKEQELRLAGEKRKSEGSFGSSKKFKSGSSGNNNSNNKKKNDHRKGVGKCEKCNSSHSGPCTKETLRCAWCGEYGHLKRDCKSDDPLCFKCKKKGHISPNCPENQGGYGNNAKKPDSAKAKSRAFCMTVEEARETEDVVHGTFLVKSVEVNQS